MKINEEKLQQARTDAEIAYKAVGKVKCPYFDEYVHFNAEGFKHLLFNSWNKARPQTEQYIRLKLFPLAVKVLSQSHTLQEYYEIQRFERVQSNSKWKEEMRLVKYYAFQAILNNVLVKVIVKQVEGRNKNFHSIIPKWKVDRKNRNQKILHSGNLEDD